MSHNATNEKRIMRAFTSGLFEAIKICGMLVFLIGFMSLIGHIAGKSLLYAWAQPAMAINTSIGFVLTGVGLFCCGIRLEMRSNGR